MREIWGEKAPPVDPWRLNHLCRHSGARPHYWEAVLLAEVLGLEWEGVAGVLGEMRLGWSAQEGAGDARGESG